MENSEIRAQARAALKDQWGTNAAIVFCSRIFVGFFTLAVANIGRFDTYSYWNGIITFLIAIFIAFAFIYAQYFVALKVIRGNRAEFTDIFVIFSGKYYLPMFVFNLVSTFLQFLSGLIIYVPMLLIFGFASYANFAFGGLLASLGGLFRALSINNILYMLVTVVTVVLFVLFVFIVSGIFQFAAWAKIENPTLPIFKAISYAWFLIKDRLWKYILLNVSFIGWGLSCIFVLPVLWVLPYYNTSMAAFYVNAQNEKEIPEIID